MWQLEADATSASSGSTASAADSGSGTTDGEDEALTVTPPSNAHSCARLYLLSVNFSLLWRAQVTFASYLCIHLLYYRATQKDGDRSLMRNHPNVREDHAGGDQAIVDALK